MLPAPNAAHERALLRLVEADAFEEAKALIRARLAAGDDAHYWETQLACVLFLSHGNHGSDRMYSRPAFLALTQTYPDDLFVRFWYGYAVMLVPPDDDALYERTMWSVLADDPTHPYAQLQLASYRGEELEAPPSDSLDLRAGILPVQPGNLRNLVELVSELVIWGRSREVLPHLQQAPRTGMDALKYYHHIWRLWGDVSRFLWPGFALGVDRLVLPEDRQAEVVRYLRQIVTVEPYVERGYGIMNGFVNTMLTGHDFADQITAGARVLLTALGEPSE